MNVQTSMVPAVPYGAAAWLMIDPVADVIHDRLGGIDRSVRQRPNRAGHLTSFRQRRTSRHQLVGEGRWG